MTYEEIIQFHGHECPGLAMGYRMATAAMDKLDSIRADQHPSRNLNRQRFVSQSHVRSAVKMLWNHA